MADDSIERIAKTLSLSSRTDLDDFDRAGLAGDLLREVLALTAERFAAERLAKLKRVEDPALARFASGLKRFLEAQKAYLGSLSDTLLAPDDAVLARIWDLRAATEAMAAQEKTLLRESEALLSAEESLSAQETRLDALISKKAALEAARDRVAAVDIHALEAEVGDLEAAQKQLAARHAPLMDRKQALEAERDRLREAALGLESDLDGLEGAYGQALMEMTARLPVWVARVRERRMAREDRRMAYLAELESETSRLAEVESELRGCLKRITDAGERHAGMKDILETHFQANRELASSFARSLTGMDAETGRVVADIADDLKRLDGLLADQLGRIRETDAAVQKMGLQAS